MAETALVRANNLVVQKVTVHPAHQRKHQQLQQALHAKVHCTVLIAVATTAGRVLKIVKNRKLSTRSKRSFPHDSERTLKTTTRRSRMTATVDDRGRSGSTRTLIHQKPPLVTVAVFLCKWAGHMLWAGLELIHFIADKPVPMPRYSNNLLPWK